MINLLNKLIFFSKCSQMMRLSIENTFLRYLILQYFGTYVISQMGDSSTDRYDYCKNLNST